MTRFWQGQLSILGLIGVAVVFCGVAIWLHHVNARQSAAMTDAERRDAEAALNHEISIW